MALTRCSRGSGRIKSVFEVCTRMITWEFLLHRSSYPRGTPTIKEIDQLIFCIKGSAWIHKDQRSHINIVKARRAVMFETAVRSPVTGAMRGSQEAMIQCWASSFVRPTDENHNTGPYLARSLPKHTCRHMAEHIHTHTNREGEIHTYTHAQTKHSMYL